MPRLKLPSGRVWKLLPYALLFPVGLMLGSWDILYLVAFLGFLTLFMLGGLIAFDRSLLLQLLYLSIPLSLVVDFSSGLSLWLPSEALALLMAFLLGSYFLLNGTDLLKNPIIRHPISLILLAIVLWDLITVTQSFYTVIALKKVIVKVIYILVYYLGTALWIQEKNFRPYRLFLIFGISMIVPVINGLIVHQRVDFSPKSAIYMPKPFFPEHTMYGAVLAFITLVFLVIIWKRKALQLTGIEYLLSLLVLPILVIGLIYSYSRAAWLSVFFALFVLLLARYGVRFWGFMFLLFCTTYLAFSFQGQIIRQMEGTESVSNQGGFSEHLQSSTNLSTDVSNLERLNRWKSAWRMFQHHPLFGHGPGTYQFIYGSFQKREDMTRISTFTGDKGNAHSEYLTALSETGLPGLILFLIWIFLSLYYGLQGLRLEKDPANRALLVAAVLGLLSWWMHGVFNTFSDYDKIAALIYLSTAIVVTNTMRSTTANTSGN